MFVKVLPGSFLVMTLILTSPALAVPEPGPDSPMVGAGELPPADSVSDPGKLTRMLEVAADEAYRLALSEKRPSDIFFWDPTASDEQRVLDRIVEFRTRAESIEQDVGADRTLPVARSANDPAIDLRTFAPENIGDGRRDRPITAHEVELLRVAADEVIDSLDVTRMPRTKRYWILEVQPILVRLEDLAAR